MSIAAPFGRLTTAMVTPFKKDLSIDWDGVATLAQHLLSTGHDGIVVNGTMSSYEQTKQIKSILESRGYKTMMVFVNTSNEVSKQRNEARALTGARVINESTRFSKWQSAQVNAKEYLQLFEQCCIVDNSMDAITEEHTNNLHFLKKLEFSHRSLTIVS